jgi:hypothetical protein
MGCSSAEWMLATDVEFECFEMMPSWCRQVNWGKCWIPWVNCAVLCVKDHWKGSYEPCAIVYQNWAVYSVFRSGNISHSKISQFNWECIWRLMLFATQLLKLILVDIRYYGMVPWDNQRNTFRYVFPILLIDHLHNATSQSFTQVDFTLLQATKSLRESRGIVYSVFRPWH